MCNVYDPENPVKYRYMQMVIWFLWSVIRLGVDTQILDELQQIKPKKRSDKYPLSRLWKSLLVKINEYSTLNLW